MKNKKSIRIMGIIACLVFFVLFSIGAYLFYPKTAVRLYDLSSREINGAAGDKAYYSLGAGDYRVLDQFEEKELRISRTKGSGRKVTHGYYTVQICDKNNEPLVIAVRVDKRRKNIGDDDTYQILGMIADMPDEIREKLDKAYTAELPVADVILNDVSETQSLPKTIILAIMALISLVSMVKIILNKRRLN